MRESFACVESVETVKPVLVYSSINENLLVTYNIVSVKYVTARDRGSFGCVESVKAVESVLIYCI